MTSNPETLKGRLGSYRLSTARPFAYGRISVLYEAVDKDGQSVCVKLFREVPASGRGHDTSEFFRELEAQQQLRHDAILPVLDYGEQALDDSGPFIVYPMCRGGNLRERLRGRTYLPLGESIPLLACLGAALDYAHGMGFLHGDIKPENVLFLTASSKPLLADFGMSRHYPISEDVSSKIVPDGNESPGGSSAYLSPEELAHGSQTTASDLYAFGVVAFELLTGGLPFERRLPLYQQMQARVLGQLRDPAGVNPSLPLHAVRALRVALSLKPTDRFGSAESFCRSLAGEVSPPERTRGPNRVHAFWSSLGPTERVAILTAGIAAVATIVAAVIGLAS